MSQCLDYMKLPDDNFHATSNTSITSISLTTTSDCLPNIYATTPISINESCDKTININNNNHLRTRKVNELIDNNYKNNNNNNDSYCYDSNKPPPLAVPDEDDDEIITVVVSTNNDDTIDLNKTENINESTVTLNIKETTHVNGGITNIDDSVKVNDENSKLFPKSILNGDKTKSLTRKKSVSFDTEEDTTRKFIGGEEIVDKQNPFRSQNIETIENPVKYKIVKIKKTAIPQKVPQVTTDASLKDEILKQSKYVPVYIRNPDKVFTYDRSVLERLNSSESSEPRSPLSPVVVKKTPIPVPRKSKLPEPSLAKKEKDKRRNTKNKNSQNHIKYPDLSDIKVKVGTDIDESLYDPNEVALNVIKFNSRFKNIHYGSTDDLDEIIDLEDKEKQIEEDKKAASTNGGVVVVEEKKSYTNTVNSEEFRDYLKKKGLVLFPAKVNGFQKPSTVERKNLCSEIKPKNPRISESDEVDSEMEMRNGSDGKKRSVFSRLSSIFSKGKTTPKDSAIARTSYLNKNVEDPKATNIKRVVLERSSFHGDSKRSSIPANNEFTRQFSSREPLKRQISKEDDDQKSSISSMLTAAEDYVDMVEPSPVLRKYENRESYIDMAQKTNGDPAKYDALSMYRNIDLNKSKLYQTKVKQNSLAPVKHNGHPPSFDTISQLSDDIIKPRVQRPTSIRSLIKPPVPLRRSSERQSLPVVRSGERYKPQVPDRTNLKLIMNGGGLPRTPPVSVNTYNYKNNVENYKTPRNSIELLDEPTSTSTPNTDKIRNVKSPEMSPIVSQPVLKSKPNQPEIDPYTFVKIHEIKRKTDEVLFKSSNKESADYQKLHNVNSALPAAPKNPQIKSPQLNDGNFVRNSPQRNTISDMYRNRLQKHPQQQQQQQFQYPPAVQQRPDDEYGYGNYRMNLRQPQHQTLQPPRSQSVLDNMTTNKNALYGEVNLRHGNGSVIMRRPESSTLDKKQIMQKIYEYYRKSVNNTPVPFEHHQQKNLQVKTQSTDTSPVSYASVNTTLPRNQMIEQLYSNPQTIKRGNVQYNDMVDNGSNNYYNQKHIRYGSTDKNSTIDASNATRNKTISESDSVFLPEGVAKEHRNNVPMPNGPPVRYIIVNSEKLTPADVLKFQQHNNIQMQQQQHQQQQQKQQKNSAYDPNRIYDVVYGSQNITPNSNGTYGHVKPQPPKEQQRVMPQRPASAMGYSTPVYYRHQAAAANGRSTPLILHPAPPQQLPNQMDIIYNNQIYRPLSAMQQTKSTLLSPRQRAQLQAQQQQLRNKQMTEGKYRYDYPAPLTRKLEMTPTSIYESESGSEAGEVQRIMQNRNYEEDYQNEKSSRNQQNEQVVDDRSRRSSGRREDPRRHTLGADMLHYSSQGGSLNRSMDLEMGQNPQKSRKGVPIRAYTPSNQGPLFDDDPGIMSEVETASTGFRRGGKQRSSLPVVRTPSKTLERPLGLVFLQYRSETKRALLPNEITSIDTVRALFVRSFPRQLSMIYLEGPNVKIYIHDSSKDMFYELEDVRSHLREIRDRSVLRLFESNEVAAPQALPGGPGVPQPLPQQGGHWEQDQSYFSEPEFDSEYQHQHIHKSKAGKAPYYVGSAQTLPRGHMYGSDRSKNSIGVPAKPLRSYGSRGSMGPQFPYPQDQLYSIPDGYMSSPERATRAYEEPYYSQYGTRGSSVTPIIDEEQNDPSLIEDQYSMYSGKVPNRISRNPNQMYDPARPEDLHRIRVEHMERQLANLTGLVQKALVQNPQAPPVSNHQAYLGVPGQYRNVLDDNDFDGNSSCSSTSMKANGTTLDDLYIREKPPKLGKSSCHKSVSFEKSVSFSDDIQGVPKSHSPQHLADTKPTKPAIKSSTLPRTSSQERDRLKPAPPVKTVAIANQYRADLTLAPEVYNHLRGLQKKAKDLRTEVRTLRRLAQTQAVAVREDIKDTFMRIRATLMASSGNQWGGSGDQEKTRISREEEIYKQEVIRLEKDLADLEASVEVLRGEVINRRTRVNMAAVEDMALVLSRASKTVAELKMRFPNLQQNLRNILANEMEKVCREEKFLKDEPDRLEVALRRCKKLTGTLVTLKRLASVQEQRTCGPEPLLEEETPRSASESSPNSNKPIPSPRLGSSSVGGGIAPENALDALLDELQTFAKPPMGSESRPDDSTTSDDSSQTLQNTVTTKMSQSQLYPEPMTVQTHGLRRLHSYPSGSDTDTQDQSPPQPPRPGIQGKPPVPERNAELLSRYGKKIPPPPPPRTSSRSPLASPTSPNLPPRMPSLSEQHNEQHQMNINNNNNSINNNNQYPHHLHHAEDSGSESANSQDNNSQRQMVLELRHQELLKKQKQLQEQYQRLQQISKNSIPLAPTDSIKKTGSESNLPQKMGLNMSISGSMKNLTAGVENNNMENDKANDNVAQPQHAVTTNKVYETDIL